jgi:hypothetical protein
MKKFFKNILKSCVVVLFLNDISEGMESDRSTTPTNTSERADGSLTYIEGSTRFVADRCCKHINNAFIRSIREIFVSDKYEEFKLREEFCDKIIRSIRKIFDIYLSEFDINFSIVKGDSHLVFDCDEDKNNNHNCIDASHNARNIALFFLQDLIDFLEQIKVDNNYRLKGYSFSEMLYELGLEAYIYYELDIHVTLNYQHMLEKTNIDKNLWINYRNEYSQIEINHFKIVEKYINDINKGDDEIKKNLFPRWKRRIIELLELYQFTDYTINAIVEKQIETIKQ